MRLIDADALELYVERDFVGVTVYDVTPSEAVADFIDMIDAQPTIDAQPEVHGYWIGLEYDGYADGNPVYDVWECSVCGNEVSGEDVPDTHPYCNSCGAEMDGGNNETD